MSGAVTEGGLRDHRIEFAREPANQKIAYPPDGPSYEFYADTMYDIEWSPSPGLEEFRGLSNADPEDFNKGPEEHTVTVTHPLQRFPVDQNGDPDGAIGDGLTRDSDNKLPNSHTIVDREDKGVVAPESTVNGSTAKATRMYTVGLGARIDDVSLVGDPGSSQPIEVEVTYTLEKGRRYQIDQPSAATDLAIKSTHADDTSQYVRTESDDPNGTGTSETIQLDGTTEVTTSATDIESIDSIFIVDASDGTHQNATYTRGDVKVLEGTGGDELAVIHGWEHYTDDDVEGDSGVPGVGSGSRASAIGSTYETILGDTIERPAGTGLGFELNSVELSVSNNIGSRERTETFRMALSEGDRDTNLTATIVGETESVKNADEALAGVLNNIVWTLSGGTITVDSAALTSPGSILTERGQSAMSLDNEFTGQGLSLSTS